MTAAKKIKGSLFCPVLCPYSNLSRSAKVLDDIYLKELLQTIELFLDPGGESNKEYLARTSASYRIWKNHTDALADYGNFVAKEILIRQITQDTGKTRLIVNPNPFKITRVPYCLPDWFGTEDFHRWHRQYLLHKNSKHYSQYWKDERPLSMVIHARARDG